MITADSLTKHYGTVPVVQDVSFTCRPGTITGFLGPNGAGKSTTLRMITGLTAPEQGTSAIDGKPFVDLPNPITTVGTLLDPSAMHSGRTGRGTLAIAARIAGVPLTRVDQVLEMVGLSASAGRRRVGAYSLGMRQRLGIAQALIGDPHILILDEPANGLDPEGIAWMRTLLRGFADRGGTVLLSSHLLGEVQATVDHLVVISQGSIVAAGSLSELLASGGLLVRSPDAGKLPAMLDRERVAYSRAEDGAVVVDTSTGAMTAETLARLAVRHQVLITELRASDNGGLEHLFFSLTGGDAPAPAVAA
ncbi:MAG: ATP-binding cassette domain-containing protein [Jatrophihabitans sp.]